MLEFTFMKKYFLFLITTFFLITSSKLNAEDFCSSFWDIIKENTESKQLYNAPAYNIVSYGFDIEKTLEADNFEAKETLEEIRNEAYDGIHDYINLDVYHNDYSIPLIGGHRLCTKGKCSENLKKYLDDGNYLTIAEKYYYDVVLETPDWHIFHESKWLPSSTIDVNTRKYPSPYETVIELINDRPIKDYSISELIRLLYTPKKGDKAKFRIRHITGYDYEKDFFDIGGFWDIELEANFVPLNAILVKFRFEDFFNLDTANNEFEFNYTINSQWYDFNLIQTLNLKERLPKLKDGEIWCGFNKRELDDLDTIFWRSFHDIKNFKDDDITDEDTYLELRLGNITKFETNIKTRKSIYEDFDLNNFPFDTQTVTLEIYDDKWMPSSVYYHYLHNILDGDLAPIIDKNDEWKYKKHHVFMAEKKTPNGYDMMPRLVIDIDIERNSNYYIFKIFLPIFILVLVSFSSFFINPLQLESKLTLTVVIFLALIAYIFVIDENIPKLSYMTILDYYVLIAFIFTAIPNLMAIYTYQYFKKNNQLNFYLQKSIFIVFSAFIVSLLTLFISHANIYSENIAGALSIFNFNK